MNMNEENKYIEVNVSLKICVSTGVFVKINMYLCICIYKFSDKFNIEISKKQQLYTAKSLSIYIRK